MENEYPTAQTNEDVGKTGFAGDGYADVTEPIGEGESAEAVFSDGEEEERDEEARSPRQSAEQNAENARRRRENERRRAKQTEETVRRERLAAREEAILEVLDGQNPFTGEEMKDARDIEEYLMMKEIDRRGGDPLQDFSRYHKEKERQREEVAKREVQTETWYRKDRDAFVARYPNVDLNELIEDEGFVLFAEGKTGNKPLSEIYEGYLSLRGEQKREARQMAAQMLANQKASPGALSGTDGEEQSFFSAEEVRKMTPGEVRKHYETIMRSMQKWK